MTIDIEHREGKKEMESNRNRITTGIALIALGGLWLVNELFEIGNFGMLLLPGLALIFLIWGIAAAPEAS